MAQRHTARRFGLLARYLSQQETIVVPVTSPLNISSDKVTTQTDTVHTGLNIRNLIANRTKPTNIDLTVYQAIPTTSHPVLDRAIPTTPYPLLSRTISTTPYPLLDQTLHMMPDTGKDQVPFPLMFSKKSYIFRIVAAIIVLATSLGLYFIWHPVSSVSSVPVVTPQNVGVTVSKISASKSGTPTNLTAGDIQVYIIGAVQHPGIYTLPTNARVYQLLQAAGGPSSNANLIALNLAAKLNDGQEVYVIAIGESVPPPTINSLSSLSLTPSSSSSQNPSLVNINTASANELSQQLKVSSKTAQAIVSYRQQHGAYTSVDQLSQVISKSIYDKIKNNVTV